MTCCRFQRARSDFLFDKESGKSYCGSCWQAWVTANGASIAPSATLSPVEVQSGRNLEDNVFDDASVGELEASVSEDGVSFFLLSRKLNRVFSHERTEEGCLRCIGRILANGEVRVDVHPKRETKPRNYPFKLNPADHCETPRKAYADLEPVLKFLASARGVDPEGLSIYDPYFCDGAVKRHLSSLGYLTVYNECEDFYAKIDGGDTPHYDVLVTNPPYFATAETDHCEKVLQFAVAQKKPFFILQPNYVYTKPYWERITAGIEGGPHPFFLTPGQPREYIYETPFGLRDVKSAKRKTSPFVTMWYCWLGPKLQASFYSKWASHELFCPGLTLACTEYFLPDKFKDSSDKTRRKEKRLSKKRRRE